MGTDERSGDDQHIPPRKEYQSTPPKNNLEVGITLSPKFFLLTQEPLKPSITNSMLFTAPYFHPRPPPSSLPPFLTPSPCQTPLLSVLFPTSYTLSSAGFMSLGMSSMLQSMNRHHEPTALHKPKLPPICSIYLCRVYSLWHAWRNLRSPTPHAEVETSHVLQNKTLHRAFSTK